MRGLTRPSPDLRLTPSNTKGEAGTAATFACQHGFFANNDISKPGRREGLEVRWQCSWDSLPFGASKLADWLWAKGRLTGSGT